MRFPCSQRLYGSAYKRADTRSYTIHFARTLGQAHWHNLFTLAYVFIFYICMKVCFLAWVCPYFETSQHSDRIDFLRLSRRIKYHSTKNQTSKYTNKRVAYTMDINYQWNSRFTLRGYSHCPQLLDVFEIPETKCRDL